MFIMKDKSCLVLILFFCFSFSSLVSDEVLYDLTLEQAELIAIENNNTVNSLRELYYKAKEGRLEAISKWFPKVEAMSIMYGLQRPLVPGVSESAFETQLALTQAFLSTNRYYDVKIASLVVSQLELLLNAAIIDVLYQTRTSYYQVILDMEMLSAAKDKVELLKTLAKKAEEKHQVGTSILYSVNQSKVAIANATNYYYDIVKQKKIDLDNLANILGYIPGEVILTFPKLEIPVEQIQDLKEKLLQMQLVFNEKASNLNEEIFKDNFPLNENRIAAKLYSKSEISDWEDLALKYTPSLKVYENYVEIAAKEVSKAKATYLPEVGFNFNIGGNPSTVQNLPTPSFGNQSMYWGAGLRFEWLVFDSLGRERRIKQAQYEKKSKEFNYRQEKQNTFFEVRKKIYEIEESVVNYMTAQANVTLAEQTVSLAKEQLDVGYGTIFDCQVTLDGFVQATNNKNIAKYQLLKAYYGLRRATGVDLETHKN